LPKQPFILFLSEQCLKPRFGKRHVGIDSRVKAGEMAGLLRGIGRAFSNLIPAHEEEPVPVRQSTGASTPTSSYLIPSEAVSRRSLPRGTAIRETLSSIPASRASSDSEDAEPVRGYSETTVPVRFLGSVQQPGHRHRIAQGPHHLTLRTFARSP
jgi:hypothetical protein